MAGAPLMSRALVGFLLVVSLAAAPRPRRMNFLPKTAAGISCFPIHGANGSPSGQHRLLVALAATPHPYNAVTSLTCRYVCSTLMAAGTSYFSIPLASSLLPLSHPHLRHPQPLQCSHVGAAGSPADTFAAL